MLSLARGNPRVDFIPEQALAELAGRAAHDDPEGLWGYGPPTGYPPLRRHLALSHRRPEEDVLVSPGSMVLLRVVIQVLLRRPGPVVVEAPTYDRTLTMLRQLGARVATFPAAGGEPALRALRALLEGGPVAAIYLLPSFQNPTGATMDRASRQTMVELAAAAQVPLIEDDPYGRLVFDAPAHPTLLEMDEQGTTVLRVSSYSKTLSPGLRVGTLVGPGGWLGAIAELARDTYIAAPQLPQAIAYWADAEGLVERNVARVRPLLRACRDALVAGLREHLPSELGEFEPPGGGYYLWLQLADHLSEATVEQEAAQRGLQIGGGRGFYWTGGPPALRLVYSTLQPEELTQASVALSEAITAAAAVRV
jgi:2-aminoadipate transaminase